MSSTIDGEIVARVVHGSPGGVGGDFRAGASSHDREQLQSATATTTTTSGAVATKRDATLALDNTKAGMGAVDKETIERVINEASKGSKFYVNEQRKAQARAERLEKAKAKVAQFESGKVDKLPLRRHCDDVIQAARSSTVLGSFIHFDMDAFYAAVEELLNPALKGVPFGVGGMGMLSTSNYEARKYGVRAGMPGYIAKKLCPQLVFAHSGFDNYRRYSDMFKAVVAEYDPSFSSHGLDELVMNASPFLERQRARLASGELEAGGDDGGAAGLHHRGATRSVVDAALAETTTSSSSASSSLQLQQLPATAAESRCLTAAQVAWEIRARVYASTKLTVSAGIAPTPALSKILSNFEKPDGQSELIATSVDDLKAFMDQQPIRRIGGVGRVLDDSLAGLGYRLCHEVFDDRVKLCHALTPKTFDFLLTASMGCQGAFAFGDQGDGEDAADDGSLGKRKSVGAERTFGAMATMVDFMNMAEHVFDKAFASFDKEELSAKQVGIKIKRRTFEVTTTVANLDVWAHDRETLWGAFEKLLAQHVGPEYGALRLLGVRFSALKRRGASDDAEAPDAGHASKPEHGSKGGGGAKQRQKAAGKEAGKRQRTLGDAFQRVAHQAQARHDDGQQRAPQQPPPAALDALSGDSDIVVVVGDGATPARAAEKRHDAAAGNSRRDAGRTTAAPASCLLLSSDDDDELASSLSDSSSVAVLS